VKQRARIVCTLGPASDAEDVLRAMIRAGMDVARLNFSHGDHATHAARIARVRRIAKEENAIVAILGDLQGPKIRVGEIAGGAVSLAAGATFTLTTRAVPGDANAASVDLADLPRSVKTGQRILLDDGLIEVQDGTHRRRGGGERAFQILLLQHRRKCIEHSGRDGRRDLQDRAASPRNADLCGDRARKDAAASRACLGRSIRTH
jgi:pyruvate kinase